MAEHEDDIEADAETGTETKFDPEKFEEKYVYYFEELETAYSNAYQQLHGRVDSEVLRAIDRQVLSESEPIYEGNGEFSVELPDDPKSRVGAIGADEEQFEAVLSEFTDRIEGELRRLFGFDAAA
ncbi:uncharacterized protein Nmag_3346 [Natrialba magadii ATCC 43099]|uniref:Uncharacterized protein n=1 Tax=Natrialba magadii (strain ATCC 43099 / DSM 3394 / CCM 3739 / CIP 104546 / IAM 13178 / JCM 8861 / NBRC 102185 / NCIMB 2190 / MS3) TaxID=547559 RepID=D3SSQ1_NATMM|nr:DUF5783 family protein [Natrialba magadii]ADD06896.1 uncharacterized protein Nmag_3346 [Natrialba magadii ATCC 43099]ELY28379.1 hypothetical protein C500_13497 [Natrialba magadii ATCC 43099]